MPARDDTVTIGRWTLAGLATALLLALLGLAYLLGRESARRDEPVAAAPATSPEAAPAEAGAEPVEPEAVYAAEAWPAEPTPFPDSPPSRPAAEPEPPSEALAEAPPHGARGEIARYFREVESIEASGKYWTDPNALAMTLLSQGGAGDTAGFDRLLEAQRSVLDRLRAIDAPSACAEHHRMSLVLIEQSVELLRQLRDGVVAGDAAALASLAMRSRQLQDDARKTDALAAEIKRDFGLGG